MTYVVDKDKNKALNVAFNHLPTVIKDDFRSRNAQFNNIKVCLPSKNQFPPNHRADVETGFPNCSPSNRLAGDKTKYQGSSSVDLPPKRYLPNPLVSLQLKDSVQDKIFENHDFEYKSVQHSSAGPKQRVTSMRLHSLQNLIKKSADEILRTILDKESGFLLTLEENFNRDLFAYILIALGIAITSALNINAAFMLSIVSNKFLVNVQQYLVSLKVHKCNSFHLVAVVYLIRLLLKFQIYLPFSACDILSTLLTLLKDACECRLSQNNNFFSESAGLLQKLEKQNASLLNKYTLNQIKEKSRNEKLEKQNAFLLNKYTLNHIKEKSRNEKLEKQNASLLNKYTLNQIKEKSRNEKLQISYPPEDYRSIPVLPSELDIQQSCAFLRPNIIKGRYQNTEHYLDVQYRLLREDYVGPLREGIKEYLTFKGNIKSLKRIKDFKIYPKVQILKQEFVNNELLHLAYIKDKEFAKIEWEFSKRLLSKSLLCLSSDNFKTMLFATVAGRDPKDLTKGLLFLRFEELTDEVLDIDPSRNFVVIETSAYFEAYRYNLEALREIKDDTLPLKRYIIETQKTVLKPQYLSETITYDLRPVLLPLNEASRKRGNIRNGKFCSDYRYSSKIPETLKNVTVLNGSLWPTFSDLNLDPSQYAALKAAITKEFAIIQGPPGTGKSYVGLRIAQLLLHNADKWQSRINPSPILVICYTNHALDQFLEGILTFTDKIVKIGGGGSNEAISNFKLYSLKKDIGLKKEFPRDIVNSIKEKREQLRILINSVEKTKQSIESSYKKDTIRKLHQQIREKYNELQEMRTKEDIYVCKQALVIGMTTTGAAKYRHIVQNLNPRIVIAEEAAEVLESHIITSLAKDTQHLILIGDHQQLRPNPTVHLLATKYGMNISLFERMIENGLDFYKLEIQHRMRPEIASLLVPHIYTKLYNHEIVKTFENIKGVAKNVFFVNHAYYELSESDSKSKINVHEANFMLRFCKYLIMQGYKSSQITVLTTYSGQLSEFKKSPLISALPGIRFTVVDNYQGEENDIILISFVRSNEEGQIGFLKISNRVCVALSRARKGLYCIGNFSLLAEQSNLWKSIIKTLEDNQAIGPSLSLVCQNHPDTTTGMTNDSDFDLVSEGGCTRQCNFQLLCGHQCSLKCHPYNPEHKGIQCPKPCAKECNEGHLCTKKCYEKCQCHPYDPKHENIHCSKPCAKHFSKGRLCTMKFYNESPSCAFPEPKTIGSLQTITICRNAIQAPRRRIYCSIL
ncbi:unnamed protein product [Larinioides sclopetarius]|uniref:NFX1-type zinc finger-containing protein 1 n=1 Tax=Larinioides sclopetarius TaxID=280406 RepID=A0AAV2AN21_9ARAC